MATLSITVGALTSSKTISAAHTTRLQAALTARIQQDRLIANPTNQQIADYVIERLFADLATLTRQFEKDQDGVTNIAMT